MTKNIGTARSKGVEVQFQALPFRGFTIGGGVSYALSKVRSGYDYSASASCVAVGASYCDQSRVVTVQTPQGSRKALDLAGLYVPQTPKVTASLQAGYEGPLTERLQCFVYGQY